MTLYFENPVTFPEPGSISVNGVWHATAPLLAVASFSQDRGGFVTIFDELGEALRDINYPVHRSYQITALTWHPERTILATGWENGELKVWNGMDKEFIGVGGPHNGPITLLAFSEKGTRLVSCDSTGSVVGWKVDSKGETVTTFHLDLKDTITHLTFRLSVKNQADFDVEDLARAAVNGDERALDMFSNWRPKTTARKFRVQTGSDQLAFYVGTQGGTIHYVNNSGSCVEVLNTEGVPLSYIVHHPVKDALIVMMEGLTIGHFQIESQGHLVEMAKVKLSGRIQSRSVGNQGLVWAGLNCLAILTGDLIVRVWDIESNDNYVLPTSLKLYSNDNDITSINNRTVNEVFTCLAYCKLNQTLCAGTNIGRIYFWTKIVSDGTSPEDSWELNNVNSISGTIKQLQWGSVHLRLPLLSVNCVTSVYIMKEQTICTCFSDKLWATQKTASQILLETSTSSNYLLQLEQQITDMSVFNDTIIFTNGRTIFVYNIKWTKNNDNNVNDYELNTNLSKQYQNDTNVADFTTHYLNSFSCENEKIILYDKIVVALALKAVELKTLNGSSLLSITSNSAEGEPIGIDVTGGYLTIFTIEGYLKIYDLNNDHNNGLLTPARNLYDMCADFGEIIQAKTNCNGTKVALTLAAANLIPDGKIYVWDIENDNLLLYDFHQYGEVGTTSTDDDFEYKNNNQLLLMNDDDNNNNNHSRNDAKLLFDDICANRIPLYLYWDNNDARLLVCNAKKIKLANDKKGAISNPRIKSGAKKTLKNEDHIIITMFISSENGISMHDIKATDPETKLLAVSTPYIILLQKLCIVRELMSDFNGLENCNKATRDAVLDFSYNLSLGNMDAAFKAIKLIQSSGVWASLAKMCVKTRRLDVAGVCLGHMGNASAAMGLRLAIADSTLSQEAKLAVLAVHLGMLDDAEQLYIQCERYDLLNELLRSRNKIEEAHKIAETKNRIHLKNTEHAWARILEENGDFKEAAVRYEKANTHRYDVPRMLLDYPLQLEKYVLKSKDPELLKWWGQYLESQGDMTMALKIYTSASDVYSQVRVLCYMGEDNKAAELARTGNDKAAYYHMARHYESVGDFENAVSFFTRANAYNNAVRLCKEHHMSEDLWNIGGVAGNREKLECARYFEEYSNLDRAVILYHRAGMLHKALDLAFKSQQFDVLEQIASDLDSQSDPALVVKCAEYFVTNEQFDKAVNLLAISKNYKEAINICLNNNVQLTEDLTEKLTPSDRDDQLDESTRFDILEKLAESLMVQGNYHLATKKFTQAGDKVRAMKALLKSGDTDKIIFFAGVSRQKDIYIMAANYLQSLDWQKKPEVLRHIITFYSKGKALDLLANFYVACAQVEIDEFQNYEKAFGALTEASRCLMKVAQSQHVERAIDVVQQRLTTIKRFVDIRRLFERGDVQAGLTQCRQLLITGGQDLEASVRRGDIYALMIYQCIKANSFTEAKQLFGELKQILIKSGNASPITYYLNKDMIEALANGLGVPLATLLPTSGAVPTTHEDDDDESEFVEEVLDNDND